MVRLKETTTDGIDIQSSSFQFHNGSIKSKQPITAVARVSKFQFHNGSIKSHTGFFVLQCRICFNSTMVRLKGK